jgi:predicted MFS family arabinose efflux permease
MIYVGIAIGSGVSSAILQHWGLSALGIAGGVGALVALGHVLASGRRQPT